MGETVNIIEAANLLKVHPKTVLHLIAARELPAGRVGRAYVLLTRDVMSYVEKVIEEQTSKRGAADYTQPVPRRRRRGRF